MYYPKTVDVKLALPSSMVVEAVVEFPHQRATYRIDVGAETFGSVVIDKVHAIVSWSGEAITRVTIRVKGYVPHGYSRIDNDYTVYEHGRFVEDFMDASVELLENLEEGHPR